MLTMLCFANKECGSGVSVGRLKPRIPVDLFSRCSHGGANNKTGVSLAVRVQQMQSHKPGKLALKCDFRFGGEWFGGKKLGQNYYLVVVKSSSGCGR